MTNERMFAETSSAGMERISSTRFFASDNQGKLVMSIFNRSFRHWTLRYIFDRVQVMWYERANPQAPWLTADARRMIESWLKPTDYGLEWGSGRSTLWFGSRVAGLISVEHNEVWAQWVKTRINAHLATRIQYIVEADGIREDAHTNYVQAGMTPADESLDFCLVDGVSRDHCALVCVRKLKRGGLLIIDNANWYLPRKNASRAPGSRTEAEGYASSGWKEFGLLIEDWRCIWTTNGVCDTALWIKP